MIPYSLVQLFCCALAFASCLQLAAAGLYPWSKAHIKDQVYETCQTETFEAECGNDEVIVMTRARYGRMQIGRCVKQSLGYLGCYSDVLGVLDTMCSGRRRCSVRIPDPLLDETNPCFNELKAYLEASYTCVQVIAPMNTCDGNAVKLTRSEGYLSSYIALTTSCGLEQSPWLIQAQHGQRINITFYDFSRENTRNPVYDYPSPTQCDEYAFIMDKASGQKIKICPGGGRTSKSYMSVNHTLEITLRTQRVREDATHFLIYYKFVGCPGMIPPSDMEFVRTSELTAVLKCKDNDQSFDLLCDGEKWKGHTQNCTKVVHLTHNTTEKDGTVMDGLVLICLIGICIIICAILIGTIIICVKRINRQTDRHFYHYNAHTLYPNPRQENRANLKQLHIDNQDLEMRDHDVIYRPLIRTNQQSVVPKAPQSECLLCQTHTQDRTYDLLPDHSRTYAPAKNPRVFNNYSLKQSNLRHSLSLKLQRQPKQEEGRHEKPVHAQNNKKHNGANEKTLNKSLDCDMMLQYEFEPGVQKKPVTNYPGTTIANNSLLNNTL